MIRNIQEELKAPKSQYNRFGGYAYRSVEDILTAVKPLLVKEKADLTLTDELVLIGDRYYVKATATYEDKDSKKVVTGYARESENKKGMDASQITGTASSYARKYALNGLFLIDDTKDADSEEYHQRTSPATQRKQTVKRQSTQRQATKEQQVISAKKHQYDMITQKIADHSGESLSTVKELIINDVKESGDDKKAKTAVSKWNTLINHAQMLYNKTKNVGKEKGDKDND